MTTRPVKIDGHPHRAKARWDGNPPRPPRKGEYYLSNMLPVAYRAPRDLSASYFIMEPCP